jgi:hypothetical protein
MSILATDLRSDVGDLAADVARMHGQTRRGLCMQWRRTGAAAADE